MSSYTLSYTQISVFASRTEDGKFVLYSVGWNEKDDGGIVAMTTGEHPRQDIEKGDWVWRYPAR